MPGEEYVFIEIAGDSTPAVAATAKATASLEELAAAAKQTAATFDKAGASMKASMAGVGASSRKAAAENKASAASTAAAWEASGKRMQVAGRNINRHLSLPLAAVGAVAVKMSLDFHKSMNLIETNAGASAKEIKNMTKAILDYAASGKSAAGPKELSQGLFQIESAGLRGAKALTVLKASQDLAMLSQTHMADTTSSVVSAMKSGIQGGQDMTKAIGSLNATVGAGRMHMQDLNSAISTGFLTSAKALGLNLNEIGAALATLTNQGQPATQSATRMRMAFTMMAAATTKGEKALGSIGLTSTGLADTMRKPGGLVTAMQMLHDHLQGLSKSGQFQTLTQIFGARSAAAIMGLVNSTGDLKANLDKITASQGNVNKALAAAKADPAVKLAMAWAKVQAALVKLGDVLIPVVVPALRTLASAIGTIGKGFSGLPAPLKRLIAAFVIFGAILGTTIRGLGFMFGGLGKLLAIAPKVVVALRLMAAAAVANPWVALAAAVALAAVLIITNWKKVKEFLANVWGWMKSHSAITAVALGVAFGPVASMAFLIVRNWNSLKGPLGSTWKWMQNAAQNVFGAIKDAINFVLTPIRELIKAFGGLKHAIDIIPNVSLPSPGGIDLSVPGLGQLNPFHKAQGGLITTPTAIVGEEAPAHPEIVLASNPAYRQRNLGLWAQAGNMLGVPGFRKGGVTGGFGNLSHYNRNTLTGLAAQAHMGNPSLMAAIAMAESGGNPMAHGAAGEKGLWQIMAFWGGGNALYNPLFNAQKAKHILATQGLPAWSTWKNGAYKAFLGGHVPAGSAAPAGRAGGGAGGRSGGSGRSGGGITGKDHIVMVVMENKEYGEVMRGSSGKYEQGLAKAYAELPNMFGVSHPSYPNYLALTSGSTQGESSDAVHRHMVPNIFSQLSAKHISWGAYGGGPDKHNPASSYGLKTQSQGAFMSALASGKLPQFSFFAPDLISDTHDSSVATGDKFLSGLMPKVIKNLGPHGLGILTWDEGRSGAHGGGHIPTILVGPGAKGKGKINGTYDTYNLLALIEDAFGLKRLGKAAGAANLLNKLGGLDNTGSGGPGDVGTGSAGGGGAAAPVTDPLADSLAALAAKILGEADKARALQVAVQVGAGLGPAEQRDWISMLGGELYSMVGLEGAISKAQAGVVTPASSAKLDAWKKKRDDWRKKHPKAKPKQYQTWLKAHPQPGITPAFTSIDQGEVDKLTSRWDELSPLFDTIRGNVASGVSLGRSLSPVIPAFMSEVGRITGQPFIGAFAQGGMIPGPVGKPYTAIVHGKERILPANAASPLVLHIHGDLAPVIRAELQGSGARLVDEQQGQRYRRLVVAPGGN